MIKEYIVPISDMALNNDPMYVMVIRSQKELIRCKDCVHHIGENGLCEEWNWISTDDEYYCASARRKEQ